MKAESTVKRELSRLKRRKAHLGERIQKKKVKGFNYSSELYEFDCCVGRISALQWVIGGE